MPKAQAIREQLRALMHADSPPQLPDQQFNKLALASFRYQFQHNSHYRRYCERRSVTSERVEHWTRVPPVPTAAFKEVHLVSGEPDSAQAVFLTSGTTRGREHRGRHLLLDLSLYADAAVRTFQTFVLPDDAAVWMISLMPSYAELPHSSLAYMITYVQEHFDSGRSISYANVQRGIDYAGLQQALERATAERTPVALLGTSLSFAHWLDHLRAASRSFRLPAGSRLMDTGGFKGERREIPAFELRDAYQSVLGLDPRYCVNEYGMTELCSQLYDGVLRAHVDRITLDHGLKQGPAWLRSRVVDPDTLQEVPRGEIGILQHFDLANLYSVSAVQTEDLARETSDGIELLGRAAGAMPRGCSIAMDILLSAVRKE